MKKYCTHPVSQNPPLRRPNSLFEIRLIARGAGASLPGGERVISCCGLSVLHTGRVLQELSWRNRINAHDARSMKPLIVVIGGVFVSGWLCDRVTGWMYADSAAATGGRRGDRGGVL